MNIWWIYDDLNYIIVIYNRNWLHNPFKLYISGMKPLSKQNIIISNGPLYAKVQ